ncbi:glycosyltransferase [Ornithinicoccus hortensis]|uniref:GT2 family glycosyltransferase n=1 Tax=Ornithinicoccus hortensis TaxID=82346 RepID=A0A542YQW4_9MICO|nr:glycosyltransferase [Ornithinicoccus hortensis]TQL50314.1 GT2 family glycosyltransferase [Ornithinicoccus hortensis]
MHDVTVVLLTHPGGPVVSHVLDALASQTRRPERVVITGLERDDPEVAQARDHPLVRDGARLLVRDPLDGPDEPPLQAVLADATADLDAGEGRWWWLLHDDSLPDPEALAELIDATTRSTGVGIVGPKLVQAQNPRHLVAVGQAVTRNGRPGDSVAGQLDQGQFDQRSDVLGVPVAGMLVRADLFGELGGLDPAFGDGVEGLDLSWRSHLAGHRVLVAPGAVVRQGGAGLGVVNPTRTRTRTRQMALARGSWWSMPFRAVGVVLSSLLAALGLLLVKRPSASAGELADVRGALTPWRGLGARWRFRGRTSVRRRDLATLFPTSASAWRGTSDLVQDALTPRAAGARRAGGDGESGPVDEDAQSLAAARFGYRVWSWPLVLVTLLGVVLGLTWWRGVLSGLSLSRSGVAAGDLWPVASDGGDLWESWWFTWRGPGLGSAVPHEPWLLPMAGMTRLVEWLPWVDGDGSPAAVTATWLLFAALPLSVVTAYLATRSVLRSRWQRAVAGLLWAGLPPLAAGVEEGRVGPVLAHVLLPLVVAGFLAAARRGEGTRRTAATFGTALLLGLLGMFVPGLLVLATVAGLFLFVLGPGWSRARGLVLAALPWLLLGPWLQTVWSDPRLVLGGAGATTTHPASEPWQTLLLHPGGAQSPTLWWTIPLLVLAAVGIFRRGERGRRAGVLLVGGVLSLAAALAVPLLELGTLPEGHGAAGAAVTAWPGTYLSAVGACALLAAGLSVDRVSRMSRAGRPTVAVLAGVAVVAGLGLLGSTVWSGTGPSLTVASPPHPAVVAEQASGRDALRILELTPEGPSVTYRLEGREPGLWLRDRAREVSGLTVPAAGPGEEHLAATVNALVGQPSTASTDGADGEGAGTLADLHDLGVGFVGLRADADHALVEVLDGTPGLTRLGGSEDLVLWRVAAIGEGEDLVSPARIWVRDTDGDALTTVPVSGGHARTDGAEPGTAVPAGTSLVVSEGADWPDHVTVTADGAELVADPTAWPPAYALPQGAGEITVAPVAEDSTWHLVTLAIAVLAAFLALPLGSRSRSIR